MNPTKRRALTTALLSTLLMTFHGVAHADVVHVFGPSGDGSTREVLVSLERDDGRCVESGAPVEWSSPEQGVRVRAGRAVSQCVRWLSVSSDGPREIVAIRARHYDFDETARVALNAHGSLSVALHRRGPRVVVSTPDAHGPLHGNAYFGDNHVPLECDPRGGCSARAPSTELVVVVVGDGASLGAAALGPAASGGTPRFLIVPTHVVPGAAGQSRDLAYIAASDSTGQLSSRLRLRVGSRGGVIQNIRWERAGLAALSVAARPDAEAIDVRVRFRNEMRTQSIPMGRSWTVGGTIAWPETLRVGEPFAVDAGAVALGGTRTEAAALRIRCTGGEWVEPPTRCMPSEAGETVVTLAVMSEGRPVPIAYRVGSASPPVLARRD